MKRITWGFMLVGLLMACSTPDVQTTLPESFAHWHLPQPPDEYDGRGPLVWLGADGSEAVWGTGSSFTIASKDPNEPSVSGMPASPAEIGDELATANLTAGATAVVIISDEEGTIQSVAASVQPWADVTSDTFALFAGRELPGSGQQEGDIYAYTLEPLETAEDMLLVISVVFDNSRASGDIVVIWRLNSGESAASEQPTDGRPVLDSAGFIEALRAAGATVEPAGSFTGMFFTGGPLLLKVNAADIQLYEYADPATAEKEAREASPDGELIIPAEWIATPHFYQSGHLIVQYVGDDLNMILLLESLLGAQFNDPRL